MFCDKFAGPTVVGEYEGGESQEGQNKLLAAAQAVHSNSAIIHPKGMSLTLLEAARSGSITAYNDLVAFMNDEMTISILGQTATTSGSPGKLGNDQAQENVKDDIVKADADSLCEAFNARNSGVIRWLVDYQFPGLGRYPQMWIDCEEEDDKKTLAERDEKLSNSMEKSGLRLSKSYYVRVHGLEEDDVEEGNGELKIKNEKLKGDVLPDLQFAENNSQFSILNSQLQSHHAAAADPAMTDWVEQLRGLLNKAADLAEMQTMILSAYPDLPLEEMARIMAEEAIRSNMAGRLTAMEN